MSAKAPPCPSSRIYRIKHARTWRREWLWDVELALNGFPYGLVTVAFSHRVFQVGHESSLAWQQLLVVVTCSAVCCGVVDAVLWRYAQRRRYLRTDGLKTTARSFLMTDSYFGTYAELRTFLKNSHFGTYAEINISVPTPRLRTSLKNSQNFI